MNPKKLLKALLLRVIAVGGPQRWAFPRSRLLVLTYHRVLPPTDSRYGLEQPGMLVTPATFAKHLDWLVAAGFQFTHLSTWKHAQEIKRTPHGKWCAITFDDGWQDNYAYAFPILRQRSIPFHIYVVASRSNGDGDYWPGRLTRILATIVEQGFDLERLRDSQWLIDLLPEGGLPLAVDRDWVDGIIVACKRHPESFIYPRLTSLEDQLSMVQSGAARALLDERELSEMLNSGLLQIGCHTANHVRLLPGLGADVLHAEIVGARDYLQQRFGTPVTSFCYPNGDYSSDALALTRCNYETAVTTQTGWNTPLRDCHQMLRISMHEDATNTPTQFWAKLSGWL